MIKINKMIYSTVALLLLLFVAGCVKEIKQEEINKDIPIPSENITSVDDHSNNTVVVPQEYSTEPIMKCARCMGNETWSFAPCCTDYFDQNCTNHNGILRWADLHPIPTWMSLCMQKAPDAGKDCAAGTDCMSGLCDFVYAINTTRCVLLEKNFTGGNSFGNNFFIARYNCTSSTPGICGQTIDNVRNPGGVIHSFGMDKNILIETQEKGPIR